MKFFRRIVDLLLYGNIWIAIAAIAMLMETKLLLDQPLTLNYLDLFVFSATSLLYALNRIFGIQTDTAFSEQNRFKVISKHKTHIIIYGALAAIAAVYFYLKLVLHLQITIALLALVSLAYVLPVFNSGKRLRDHPFIKIFLVAVVWAVVTVYLPYEFYHLAFEGNGILLLFERLLFVFAITIPFDIRDINFDLSSGVKTFPNALGIETSTKLAITALIFGLAILAYLYFSHIMSLTFATAISVNYGLAYIFLKKSPSENDDYFFSGLIDGLMVFRFVLAYSLLSLIS